MIWRNSVKYLSLWHSFCHFLEQDCPPPRVGSVEVPFTLIISDLIDQVGWTTWIYRHHGSITTTQILQMEWKCGQLQIVQLNGMCIYSRSTFYTIIFVRVHCHVKCVYHGTIKMVIVPPGPNFPPASGFVKVSTLPLINVWSVFFAVANKKCVFFLTLLYCYTETNKSPLKLGLNAPKGNDCIPSIHFQVPTAVSFIP